MNSSYSIDTPQSPWHTFQAEAALALLSSDCDRGLCTKKEQANLEPWLAQLLGCGEGALLWHISRRRFLLETVSRVSEHVKQLLRQLWLVAFCFLRRLDALRLSLPRRGLSDVIVSLDEIHSALTFS